MSRRSTPQRRREPEGVYTRPVTAGNLDQELSRISNLLNTHPYVTVHAEHHGGGCGDEEGNNLPPGVRIDDLPAASRYALAKVDVDSSVPYSHLGITLCDANGKLPLVCPEPGDAAVQSVWQFWLHDTGLSAFARALSAKGVVPDGTPRAGVTWVAYGGLYHLGFLLKVLTGGARLPDTKEEFLAALRARLGDRVFDGRYVTGEVSLKGPLMHMGSLLGAPNSTAPEMEPWQAGLRSLVACQVFMRLKGLFFAWDSIDKHAGCIHGLHPPTSSN